MVKTRLELEPEVQQILHAIDEKQNFLLSGGAGSGKTYSLVQLIRQIILERPNAKIACITYTNAAVKQIQDRINHNNLIVSTIHDFLWDNIKHFKKELKKCFIDLINDPEQTNFKIEDRGTIDESFFENIQDGIRYMEFVRLKDGIISHDELLILANELFSKYQKINHILKDKFQFIFVDEYQDTHALVIKIFLEHLQQVETENIIGFFGDSMQSIYDEGVGNITLYLGLEKPKVREIQKRQNRRNPKVVIDLANLIRTDTLVQEPSTDPLAPNMMNGEIKRGSAKFIYSLNSDFDLVKKFIVENLGWPIDNPKLTKELNLTHNLIAEKAHFKNLMDIYSNDKILMYRNRIKDFIKKNSIVIDTNEKTFGEVIENLKSIISNSNHRNFLPTPAMNNFIEENPEIFELAKSQNYNNFIKMYVDKDQLIDDKKQSEDSEKKKGSKRDKLIKHLYRIQSTIFLYKEKKYNEFLKATDYRFKITSVEQKIILKNSIEQLINVDEKTIEEVIEEAHSLGICLKDDNLRDFIVEKPYLYNRVRQVRFKEFQSLYDYIEGRTPFSTKHKTKGSEFENVLVILDNGRWNDYNFSYLFLNSGTPSVLSRTQKIFYVCCTRAMERLAVFYHNPEPAVILKANQWFGEDNVICL
jgi:DNA helicase-2/ATP-dependent DNA helicase PcrA